MFRKLSRLWVLVISALLVVCILCSCTDQDESIPTIDQEESTSTQETGLPFAALSEFMQIAPEATLFDYMICDLDKDGTDDYVILFSEDDRSSTIVAGLSVCLNGKTWSAIDLASNTNFVFCSEPSLRFDEDKPVIAVYLEDPDSEVKYYYEVEYSYDSESKQTNYSISSNRIEQEDGYA